VWFVDDVRDMGYDEDLADRIRELIAADPGVTERRMFGGLAFLVGGNMAVAASGQGGLMVRVDPADTDELLAGPHARPFEMRGRAVQGWLRVDAEGVRTRRRLEPWVRRGVAYARSLPSGAATNLSS
jgi:TfoX/Sxy family transcriptional regulator of competence genes